ncbi:flagellin protein FliC [Clostridium aceticum]|uniref:Flagellin n=1 Tax=Clostridium aceticum TaxID=84022 RepID=A0A0D8I6Z6_9CLOT|nr:flagellinolysin [Clostridium aceticum]AKL93780.1 flagellin protein FliC [Clostridium aceticum]KJF25817.1 hypothetical protein TZ02_16585 [Clostridium aceticum]
MRINNNLIASNAHRQLDLNVINTSKSMEKLSSGYRINRAGDDAAGLSISEKMRGQIRGLHRASRNAQDSISLIQTMEGALAEKHAMLQRGRELSVQAANDTLTDEDKQSVQNEINQLKKEIDNISNSTHFNGIKLLNANSIDVGEAGKIVEFLQKSWLEQSEKLIKDYFGLEADGVELKINLIEGVKGGTLAYVSGLVDVGTGKLSNLSLVIEMADFSPATWPNGGTAPMYNDRIIAHEMVHAVMARTMNFAALPTWFKEGTAEFIHGADERLRADIAWEVGGSNVSAVYTALGTGDHSTWGGQTANIESAVQSLINQVDSPWVGTSAMYSTGYLATRFLDYHIRSNGGEGIKDVMVYLNTNQTHTLDDALKNISNGSYAGGLTDFYNDFKTNGLDYFKSQINLYNDDTGSVWGSDVTGGASRNAEDVVPDIANINPQPLSGFSIIWPDVQPPEISKLNFQVGANSGQQIVLQLISTSCESLALTNVNVVNNASQAIDSFDTAIQIISSHRSRLGAIQNRLQHTMQNLDNAAENLTSSESRIRDIDMAKEMIALTKQNTLQQAAQAMLAQANQVPQGVLQLLR